MFHRTYILMTLMAVTGATTLSHAADAKSPSSAAKDLGAKVSSIDTKDLRTIADLDKRYQGAKSIIMSVEKNLKLGMLGQERSAKGKLWLSSGRVRMELDGSEKSLLVVDKKNIWAVTYPDATFKDAPVQVIRGETTSKKGRSQNLVSLLSQGGFLKFFKATGTQKQPSGEAVYFLVPGKEQTDIKRAQLTISKDGKQITELRYWDDRDNETRFSFSDVTFGAKPLEEKLFKFTPPANAEIMSL